MKESKIDYVSNNCIVVVNPNGKMRQLFVPFRVQALYTTSTVIKNSWVIVEEVQAHEQHKLLYKICGNWWKYDLFRLSAVF